MRLSLIILGSILLLAFAGLAQRFPSLSERKEKIKSREANVAPEALQRKERSEKLLQAEGVPVNKSLPVIETEKEAKHRSKEEIAYRAAALLVVAMKSGGLEQPIVKTLIKDYGLDGYFTPKEKAFVHKASPSEQERIQFDWRYEDAWVLLWALGYVEKLEKPTAACDVPRAVNFFMKARNAKQFIAGAKLRSMREMLDQADRIYRYHWAVVDARVNGEKAPAALEPEVTMERHYAMNWLIGSMDQAWDDISTDT